jgi:hypothetical protein
MPKKSDDIPENPLIAALLTRGAVTATMLQGYVGPSPNDVYLRLYPALGDLRRSIDIARSDILHYVASPRSELGAIILWVKKDAQMIVNRVESSEATRRAPGHAKYVDVKKGRLRMKVRVPRELADTCVSACDTCTSQCTHTPCNGDCEVPV